MLIGYMIETSFGAHDRSVPSPADSASALNWILAEAEEVERAGFHSIVVPERHMRPNCFAPDNLSLLIALAARTQTISLGTYATVLTLHNPMQLAERIAMVDVLSGGRVFVTLARGFQADYWRMLGLEASELATRFREGVAVIQRAFAGEVFSFQGKSIRLENVFLTPLPFQRPLGPPIWAGGHSAGAINRAPDYAAAWAGGFFPINRAAWTKLVNNYREKAEKAGKVGFVALVRAGFVAATRRRAVEAFASHATSELDSYKASQSIQPAYSDDLRHVTNILPHLVIGSPDDCVRSLKAYETEFGVDYVVMRFRTPSGPTIREAIKAIRLFGSEVLPAFQTTRSRSHPALPQGGDGDLAVAK
jgi:alkanesulfonate monooxygenase SsuD/methylene tetrahydromethanopterin reductase-like flavin-dependent oxidoreductase (luciferase family)